MPLGVQADLKLGVLISVPVGVPSDLELTSLDIRLTWSLVSFNRVHISVPLGLDLDKVLVIGVPLDLEQVVVIGVPSNSE